MALDDAWLNRIVSTSSEKFSNTRGVDVTDAAQSEMKAWAKDNEPRLRKKMRDGWSDDDFTSAGVRLLDSAHERMQKSGAGNVNIQGAGEVPSSIDSDHVRRAMQDCPNC